jgi:hypothetical protein
MKLDETPYFKATLVIGSVQTSSYNSSRLTEVLLSLEELTLLSPACK